MGSTINYAILQEFALLYELSLSVGNSLDLHKTSGEFMSVLLRQKNIDYGAVWFENKDSEENGQTTFDLIYSYPDFSFIKKRKTISSDFYENIKINGSELIENEEDIKVFSHNSNEQTKGDYWIINLPDLGFIKLFFRENNQSKTGFNKQTVKKIAKVIQKFSIALKSCQLHSRIIEETNEKLKYQAETKKLAIVAQKTDNAIVITDTFGRIEWVNEAFTQITEYTIDEAAGKTPGSLLQGPETDLKTREIVNTKIKNKESFRIEILNYAKSGRKYWIDLSIQPIFDTHGNLVNYIAVNTDITQRKEFELKLTEAKEKAEEAGRIKQEFMAVISHEIHTPLNAIVGMTNLIQKTVLTPQQTDYVHTLSVSSENLRGIINGILDFAKIESGKLSLQNVPFNLKKILSNIVDSNQFRAEEKGLGLFLKFDDRADLPLVGDPVRISQILLNLISNAIKFTEKGHIQIETRLITRMRNAMVLDISVTDTGKGISPDKIDKVFDSFTQEDSSISRKYGGTGLGLSISKELVALMGGDLKVKSQLGTGSTFNFVLGFQISESVLEEQETDQSAEKKLAGKQILLVEDNPMNQFFARKWLEGWGIYVEIAENGKIGLEKSNSKYYDAILMDIQMPEMDGFTATKLIRAENKSIPIIALTALTVEEEVAKFKNFGMNDYILKPFEPQNLLKILLKHLLPHEEFSLSGKIKNEAEEVMSTSHYNPDLMLQMMKGNKVQASQMENLFLKQTQETIENFEKFYKNKQWNDICMAAHKIKASIDWLHVNSLKQPIRVIENSCRQEINEAELKEQLDICIKIMKEVCVEISNLGH
ncbi:MAG: response regulator [Cytophagaceae bacterium]|nr:response regulator [Cytophagaceae bacterium]